MTVVSGTLYYVNLYRVDQCYGGPEEGGWYYSRGTAIQTVAVADSEEDAEAELDRMRAELEGTTGDYQFGYGPYDGVGPDGEGDDRYLIPGGAWGRGEYTLEVEQHPGRNYPKRRPHYE